MAFTEEDFGTYATRILSLSPGHFLHGSCSRTHVGAGFISAQGAISRPGSYFQAI